MLRRVGPGAAPEFSTFFPPLGKTTSWPPFPSSSVVKVQPTVYIKAAKSSGLFLPCNPFFFLSFFSYFSVSFERPCLKLRWERVVEGGKGWQPLKSALWHCSEVSKGIVQRIVMFNHALPGVRGGQELSCGEPGFQGWRPPLCSPSSNNTIFRPHRAVHLSSRFWGSSVRLRGRLACDNSLMQYRLYALAAAGLWKSANNCKVCRFNWIAVYLHRCPKSSGPVFSRVT